MLEPVLGEAAPEISKQLIAQANGLASLILYDDGKPQPSCEGFSSALAFIAALREVLRYSLKERVETAPVLSTGFALRDYLFAEMAYLPIECFRVIYLNSRNMLIADEVHGFGTVDAAPVHTRTLMHRALDLGAAALLLVHNHPSGVPEASQADQRITREIANAGRHLGISVHDHVIVTRTGLSSMRDSGFL